MDIVREIAKAIKSAGGRAYFVGGYVRDRLLGVESKDIDIEVHSINPDNLYQLLQSFGTVKTIGKSFGIYTLQSDASCESDSCYGGVESSAHSIDAKRIDIALPRREKNIGRGHRNFEIFTDPYLGTRAAAGRRDFTINAIMEDVLTGELIDHFNGKSDLENGILRHVDGMSFSGDPLRVLRAAQFAARFEFDVTPETLSLCSGIDLSELPAERIETELEKGLCKGIQPSRFFRVLRDMDQLDSWFPEIKSLIGVEQDPIFHPEGDVWEHTMYVMDRAASEGFRDTSSNPFGFMLFCLTHDLGKIETTEEVRGRIHSYEHEEIGQAIIRKFLDRLTGNKDLKQYVLNMASLHMKPNMAAKDNAKIKSTNRMFDQAASPEDLIAFSIIDKFSEAFPGQGEVNLNFLKQRLEIFKEYMARPYVTGQDLIDAGFIPDEDFKEALSLAHKLRLAGVDKESALKQTIAHIKR